MKKINIVFVTFFILILASCTTTKVVTPGNKESGSGKTVEMTIDAFNFGFTASQVTINKGDKVKIKFTSSSGTHGLAIPEFGISAGPVSPGQEEIVEFVADKSGSFDYFCNIPCGSGHGGMRGKLIVG